MKKQKSDINNVHFKQIRGFLDDTGEIKEAVPGTKLSLKISDSVHMENLKASKFVRLLYIELLKVFFGKLSFKEIHDYYFTDDGEEKDLGENPKDEYLKAIKKASKLCCANSSSNKEANFEPCKKDEYPNIRNGKHSSFIIIAFDSNGELLESENEIYKRINNDDELKSINDSAMYISSSGLGMIVKFLGLVKGINKRIKIDDDIENEIKTAFDAFLNVEINDNAVRHINEKTDEERQEDDKSLQNELSIFEKEINDKNKQVIFTGAPGTGKTYGVRKFIEIMASKDEDRYKFIQFHSSYDYTDFVEGIRPVSKGEENIFVKMDGTFKAFCRKVVNDALDRLEDEGLLEVADDSYRIDALYDICKETQGENQEIKENRTQIKNKIMEKPYYFIIDEINRADTGKVFGELMFGLEQDYRGVENRFETQYANMKTYIIDDSGEPVPLSDEEDVFRERFFIPENLYIIGTMNDIDRSVETFDFALRRRFHWVEIKADEKSTEKTLIAMFEKRNNDETQVTENDRRILMDNIVALNNCIKEKGKKFGLNEAFFLGAAYFKDYKIVEPQGIWDNKIQPILKEYTRGRDVEQVAEFIRACAMAFFDCKVAEEYKKSNDNGE